MRSASCAALLLAAAALAACESSTESAETAPAAGEGHESEQEDDSDTAPFMIVVEHMGGRRCGGSLVSLRTAITSAWCAGSDGGDAPRELWALAPGAGAARRVARVALAAGAGAARAPSAWGGAAVDLAVLELEAPFGGGARSRPILMATQPAECAAGAACHVVRALGAGRAPRLRIVDAELVEGAQCAARSPGWPGLRDTALCLVGPTLCSSDWGAGVVCEGKLCGVLSRSARAAGTGTDDSCGDTHVAQSIPRWRSGGDCGQLCSERRLLGADGADSTTPLAAPSSSQRADTSDTSDPRDTSDTREPPEPAEPADSADSADSADTAESSSETEAPPEQPTTATSMLPTTHAQSMPRPVRLSSVAPPTRSAAPPPEPQTSSSPRAAAEFEPNRPDFKAGEYGDNAADYGGEDAVGPSSPKPPESSAPPPPPPADSSTAGPASLAGSPTTATPPPPTQRAAAVAARVQPVSARSRAAPPPSHIAYFLYVLVAITNLAN